MKCEKCGSELEKNAGYCTECGAKVEGAAKKRRRKSLLPKKAKKKKEAVQIKKEKREAYLEGLSDMAKFFTEECSIDINDLSGYYGPALHSAINDDSYANEDFLQTLLDYGADIDATDSDGNTALMAACKNDENKWVKFFIENSADLDCENDYNETALSIARDNGNRYLVGLLRKSGAYDEEDD